MQAADAPPKPKLAPLGCCKPNLCTTDEDDEEPPPFPPPAVPNGLISFVELVREYKLCCLLKRQFVVPFWWSFIAAFVIVRLPLTFKLSFEWPKKRRLTKGDTNNTVSQIRAKTHVPTRMRSWFPVSQLLTVGAKLELEVVCCWFVCWFGWPFWPFVGANLTRASLRCCCRSKSWLLALVTSWGFRFIGKLLAIWL